MRIAGKNAIGEPPVLPPSSEPPRLAMPLLDSPPLMPPLEERPDSSVSSIRTDQSDPILGHKQSEKAYRWFHWPGWVCARGLDFASLTILLAVVAAIPIVQFASLGYLLNAAANLAAGKPWSTGFPGLRLAGRLGTFALLSAVAWIPVWLVSDFSYSAQLLQPNSPVAFAWRFGAFVITLAWIVHVGWASMRGGRWWHFLWPAPLKFILQIWRPGTWRRASDALYETVAALQFPRLWWLGLRGAAGAFVWTVVPVSLMIIGQRADAGGAGLIGLMGAVSMGVIMLYLPFLQIQFATQNRLLVVFDVRSVRRRFAYAPIAHGFSLLLLCLLCIPLYLLRIEATPAELLWAPSLVFVLFMLPAKLLLGAAMGYADGRQHRRGLTQRHWSWRHTGRMVGLASVLVYVGALYVAQLIAGQGAFVMYFQHAFLVPAPLISS